MTKRRYGKLADWMKPWICTECGIRNPASYDRCKAACTGERPRTEWTCAKCGWSVPLRELQCKCGEDRPAWANEHEEGRLAEVRQRLGW
jgi:hypothetical protein